MIRLLALILLVATAAWAAPVDEWPCVVCHPSRDRAAFDLLRADPDVLLGDEAAQERVCWSCHNGSVVDSRGVLGRGSQHPAGVPARGRVPQPFRLYRGRIECGTCHSPHAEGEAGRRWLRVPPRGNEPCAGCHPGHGDRHLGRELPADMAGRISGAGGRAEGGRIVCATCHRPHGGSGRALLVAPYGEARDDLCRLCHRPGAPLAAHREAGCGACHRPHAEAPLLAEGRPCLACHPEAGGPRHHPSASPFCSECHAAHDPVRPGGGAGGLLRAPVGGNLLCAPCHKDLPGPHKDPVPAGADPAALARRGLPTQGEGRMGCTTCHRVHGAAVEPLLGGAPGVRCLYCHPGQNPFLSGNAGAHPVSVPVAGGRVLGCTTCHRAHGGGEPAEGCAGCHEGRGGAGHGGAPGCSACHGMHAQDPPAARCAGCHGEKQVHPAAEADARPGLPVFGPGAAPASRGAVACPTCHDPHRPGTPVRRGEAACLACHPGKKEAADRPHGGVEGCGVCHPPHGKAPQGPVEARCRGCHGDEIRSVGGHTPDGPPAWKGLGGRLPLFDRAGGRNPFGFLTCPTCHDVHRQGAFRMEPRNPPRLCLVCHGDKAALLGSPHDPRAGGDGAACDVCHPQHSRRGEPPLWKLREGAAGTWNDRKCSGCHGPPEGGPSRHAGPGSHPVNVAVPDAMDPGDLPLYDPLGGRAGRTLACPTCHDIHGAWDASGERIPRFLRLPASDGALCAGCHGGEAAVRGTPHDVPTEPPDPLGPCGPCHRAHGGVDRALWALEPAPGDYPPNRLCRSCHRQGGPIDTGTLLLQHHMKDAEPLLTPRGTIYLQRPMEIADLWALRTGQPPVIPLYDRRGRPGPVGNLQCVSCHDPHVWSPFGAYLKPGFGALGPNVVTRFLRLRDPAEAGRSVCAGCHPEDAADRYLKYHWVWTDVGEEFR